MKYRGYISYADGRFYYWYTDDVGDVFLSETLIDEK